MMGAGELSGTTTAGTFRLVRALEGGRAHEARHEHLPGRFAVELFGAVEPRTFLRAAQQASALRHPGIARVVDYGVAPGRAFVAMEWTDGRSLAALLARGGPLAPDAVARIVDSVALGLQAAHRQGLAHGHLAPERVLVLPAGDGAEMPGAWRTKILGFGPAADERGARREVSPYAAPERADAAEVADAAEAAGGPLADQYALGAIAYELLSGEAPAGTPPRSLREFDPTINVVIDDVVLRALSPDPGARWADVYTFAQRLREAADSDGALEERTRLGPLPLTVSRGRTPTPIDLPPVVASVDVDLTTPPPRRLVDPIRKLPLQGEISMTPRSSRPPEPRWGASSPTPHYGIQPTPTFSFTDAPAPGPLYKPRRARSGGGLGLVLLVAAAGAGGYFAVQARVWQDAGPLVERAKELGRSLRTLAPGASLEPPAPTPAAAPGTGPATPTPAPEATPVAAAAAPALHPDVVPIAPAAPAPRASATSRHASAARHHEHAARTPTSRANARAPRLSDEAAAEEALLGGPAGGR